MAKRRPTSRAAKPKTEIQRRVRRVIVEPDMEEVEEAEERKWFGQKPWVVIVGACLLAFLLFAPLCTVTKTVEETETIMVPVTREMPPPVAGEETIKVYQGYIRDINGTVTTIDAVNGIVKVDKAIGPPVRRTKTWVLTLTDIDGQQVVYRDITQIDLTPTGKLLVRTDETGTRSLTPSTEMVPKEVTKEKEIKSRINFFQWLFGLY
jgi:hypothetical protein